MRSLPHGRCTIGEGLPGRCTRAEIDDAADGRRYGGWLRAREKPPFEVPGRARVSDVSPRRSTDGRRVIIDGWPDDTDVCLKALQAHAPADATVLVIDCANVDDAGTRAEVFADDQLERFRVLHMEPTLHRSAGQALCLRPSICHGARCSSLWICRRSSRETRSAPCWTSSVVMASWAQDGRART